MSLLEEMLDKAISYALQGKKAGFEYEYAEAAEAYYKASTVMKQALDSKLIDSREQYEIIKTKHDQFRFQYRVNSKKLNKKGVKALQSKLKEADQELAAELTAAQEAATVTEVEVTEAEVKIEELVPLAQAVSVSDNVEATGQTNNDNVIDDFDDLDRAIEDEIDKANNIGSKTFMEKDI